MMAIRNSHEMNVLHEEIETQSTNAQANNIVLVMPYGFA